MAKKNLDELEAKSPGRFAGLKKAVFGDEQEMEVPSGLLEYADAYTGAPARSAVEKLQEDFTDIPGAFEAARKQFGASPKLAPSGKDLAKNTGLTGVAGEIAGAGLEMALDPTQLLTGGLGPALKGIKAASMIPFALKGLKAADMAADVGKGVKAIDTVSDVAKAVNAAEDLSKLSKVPTSFAEANKIQSAVKAAEAAKAAEALAMEQKMQALIQNSDIPVEALESLVPKRPAFIGPGGVVNAGSAAEGVQLAKTVPSEFGRVVQLPDVLEMRRAQRLTKKPFESMGKVFRAKK